MSAQLSSLRDSEYLRNGQELRSTISSEEQAQQEYMRLETFNRRLGVAAVISANVGLLALLVGMFWISPANAHAGLPVAFALLLAGMFGGSIVLTLRVPYRERLLQPLADHPAICEELSNLVAQSDAGRSYVRQVNLTGRQLRLFDVVCAQAAAAEAEAQDVADRQRAACVLLHGL